MQLLKVGVLLLAAAIQLSSAKTHTTVLDSQGKYHFSWTLFKENVVFEVQVMQLNES